MKLFIIAVLGMGMVAGAQQPCVGGEHPHNAPDCIPAEKLAEQYYDRLKAQSAPLKCEKYEHVEHHEGPCGPPPPECLTCLACWPVPPDRCAPDLHTVTEKEWVELMERLRHEPEMRVFHCPNNKYPCECSDEFSLNDADKTCTPVKVLYPKEVRLTGGVRATLDKDGTLVVWADDRQEGSRNKKPQP